MQHARIMANVPAQRPMQHAFPRTCHQSPVSLVSACAAPQPFLLMHHRPSMRYCRTIVYAKGSSGSRAVDVAPQVSSAKEAVETGLEVFAGGQTQAALQLFQKALTLSPNEDEARAALYNAACCHTKLKQWQPAVDCAMRAINDYDLKLVVALRDDDLAPLRERREWLQALSELKGGLSDQAYVQLRSEAKAPFRTARLILCGGLLAGASLGLLIIISRLVAVVGGAPNPPDLNETLQNAAINSAAVAILGTLVYRDLQGAKRDRQVVEREESLAKLQIEISPEKQLPLASFRGACRPVLLVGTRGHIAKCIKAAEGLKEELQARGVSVVPVEVNADDPSERLRSLKAEFGNASTAKGFSGKPPPSSSTPTPPPSPTPPASTADRKWRLKAYDVEEWITWVNTQKEAANVKGENVWIQVQLDGTVRSSGVGMPPWVKFVADLPELSDVRTKITDGMGRL